MALIEMSINKSESKVGVSDSVARSDTLSSEQEGDHTTIAPPNADGTIEYGGLVWWKAGCIMIAETISLGILGLPHALSRLGFLPGIILLLLIGIAASYTGYVTYQFKLRYPSVKSYADAGQIVAGASGRWVAEVMSMLFLVFVMGAHICTFAVAMDVLTEHGTCTVVFGVVAMVVSFILTIPRTLKGNSVISIISCLSICIAVVIAMIAIGIHHTSPTPRTYLIVPSTHTSFAAGTVSVSGIATAFTGHVAYFQIIDEMRTPTDFPKALAFLQTAAISFYLVVAVVIYAFMGQHVASPALGSASPVVKKLCYGIAIPTILVAGVITAHICAKRCYQLFWRRTPSAMNETNFRARGSWWAITAGLWVLAWLIAESIPVFNDMLGVIGAAFTAWFCLGFNSILWLALQRKGAREDRKSSFFAGWRKIGLFAANVTILAASIGICVIGLYGSGKMIAMSGKTSAPFSCKDTSS